MEYIVYVIRNPEGKLYKGMTGNLKRRLDYHNRGLSQWTKNRGPWILVYKETCQNKSKALTRERFLKSGKGREYIKSVIRSVAQMASAHDSGS